MRGHAHLTADDFDRARADLETALEMARAAGAGQTEWQVLCDLGWLWAGYRDYSTAGHYFERALALARDIGDPPAQAYSLAALGNWHVAREELLDARQCHQEALALFERMNDRRGIAHTLQELGTMNNIGADMVQSAAYYKQAIALYREMDDRGALVFCLAVLATTRTGGRYLADTTALAAPGPGEPAREGELALEIARQLGLRSGEAVALICLAESAGLRGEYTRALDLVRRALDIAQEIEEREWMAFAHCTLGPLYRDLLALPQARHHLEQALAVGQELSSLQLVRTATGLLALVCTLDHDVVRAESILNATLGPDTPSQTLGQRVCWYARAELALARGDPNLALHIVGQLIASGANVTAERDVPFLAELHG
jgi:tetratricopeptide (TPR) repeat protein